MKVIKRNGKSTDFNPNKITKRIKDQSVGLKVDSDKLSISVISQMADGITTSELDTLCAELASTNVSYHHDYSKLASRIFVTALRKETPASFSEAVKILSEKTSMLSPEYIGFVQSNAYELNEMIVQDRDFNHDIFGLKTLERSYLMRDEQQNIVERPQYMWLRVAIEVSGYEIDKVKDTYDAMSLKRYTHATPTLFNSCTKLSQLSSCFLIANKGDDIDGLFDTMKDVAKISKLSGGIGLHVHNVRAKGSLIKGTNGKADGLLPMMKTYNEVARWINQGGKRKGSFAIYLEPWHSDIFEFLDLKKNTGKEEMRARDLFYAIWNNDLFMQAVKDDGEWHLFCPNEVLNATGGKLQEVYGDEFNELYKKCVDLGVFKKKIRARELWEKILTSQIETGTPYMAYKDRANLSTNQKNLGVIQSSNLCIEIYEYSDKDEQAVCNLASLGLPAFVVSDANGKLYFDFNLLGETVKLATRNLDNVIDANYYPTVETKNSNMRHRPIGLGVQGLADVFAMLKLPFDSLEAKKLNKDIFEHIYYYSLEESNKLAYERGEYSTFKNSPASKGILQFDMYEETPNLNTKLNWESLKKSIMLNGLRNSLLIALMPTASTSQILGYNEAFEPFTSNMYTRGTLSGTFVVVNQYLIKDLEELGLWDLQMRKDLMSNNGSVMNIPRIPANIKEVYKTVYELSMKTIIDLSADRQRFVCQGQSMNLFVDNATMAKLSSMHMYAWEKKLKTGMYYLRTKPAVDAIKFTVTKDEVKKVEEEISTNDFKAMIERAKNADPDDCEMCGS